MSIFNKSKEIIPIAKKGKVYIATDQGKIVSADKLEKIQKSSKQLEKENLNMMDKGLVVRPYSCDTFLELYESNPVFFATVNQVARDVAGLGWKLLLREGKKEAPKEKEEIEVFLKKPNEKNESLRSILKALLIDWGVIGDYAIEAVRNTGGKVSEIYRVPSKTVWVHKDRKKFCQKREMRHVWFKQFGAEENINMETGEEGELKNKNANELIYSKNDYPRNDYYGMPYILPAVGSVFSLIGIRDFNLSFFTNYGVPAYLVTLDGEWAEGSEKDITDFLNNAVRGSDNAHKTLVLTQPEGCKATFEPLSTDVKEGSFKLYQQILREDILTAYSMPPYRLGINIVGKLGGSNIMEATEIYKNGVVEPLQMDIESIVNDKIIKEGMDFESYEFKFNDLDIRDLTAEIERYNKLIEHAVMTPNQAITLLGLGETYIDGNKYYVMSSLIEVGESEEGE